MAEKIFIIPIFSQSQQFTQQSTGLCADAKGPEGLGSLNWGECCQGDCAGSTDSMVPQGSLERGLSVLILNVVWNPFVAIGAMTEGH